MLPLIIYIVFCILVGFCGRYRILGFFGTFLASFLFSPLAVLLILLFTAPSAHAFARRRIRAG